MILFSLMRYTIRELIFRVAMLILTGISTLIILVMLLSISSSESADGIVITVFSQPIGMPVPLEQLQQAAFVMQSGLAGGLYTGIVLFGIIATGGVIPETLEKGLIDLYLSKPIARWELLLGRFLGSVGIILANAVYFLGAIWLIFGIKLGVWNVSFLAAPLLITLVFACLYSISMLLGILFRNAIMPIIGALLYQVVIAGLLEGRETGLFLISENVAYRKIIDFFYYLLPQVRALQSSNEQFILQQPFGWDPVVQSILTGTAVFSLALWFFKRKDF